MKRRAAIQQILILAGGIALLPSCLKTSGKASIALSNLDMSLDEEQLLAEVAETIIPRTDSPGAKDLKLHLFTMKMVDDCHPEKEQQVFLRGLRSLDAFCKEKFGKTYVELKPADREHALLTLSKENDDQPSDLAKFYSITKGRCIDGYLNSEVVMTKYVIWELVPGRYNGYFPVKNRRKQHV